MSYTPTTWQDRVVEKPNTFDVTENEDKTITLAPHPGIVSQGGTAVNANAMNHIEGGIKDNDAEIGNARQGYPTLLANLQNKDSQLADIVNVNQFGAKGDGITDDTIAIQNAINSLQNGGKVIFTKGRVYLISNTIYISSDNIELYGDKAIIKLKNGSTITSTPDLALIYAKDKNNFSIKGLVIDGNKNNQAQNIYGITNRTIEGTSTGFYADNVNVKNIKGFHGIWVYGSLDFQIHDCHISGCEGDGIVAQAYCKSFIITNCQSTENAIGIEVEGREGDLSSIANIKSNEQGKIINNICDNNNDSGILCLANKYMDISGNKVRENTHEGIKITGGSNILCNSNQCVENYRHGIYVTNETYGDNLPISNIDILNNTVSSSTEHGIIISRDSGTNYFNNVNVKNNDSHDNGRSGLFLYRINEGDILGNTLTKNTGVNMFTNYNSYMNIENNKCSNSQSGAGISIGVIVNSLVKNNKCYDTQSTKTQTYGIEVTDNGSNNTIIKDNDLRDNKIDKYTSAAPIIYEGYGTASPTTGYYGQGSKIINTAPTVGGYEGWICTNSGNPGTWKEYGTIQS